MNTLQTNVSAYSLSMEELSLCLSMINKPDMANALIKSIYPEITDKQIDSRLITATNSMLARGMINISGKNKPQLNEDLQMAIYPMVVFDQLIELISSSKQGTRKTTIYCQNGKRFTSHTIENGVVHKFENGDLTEILQYIGKYFEGFGIGDSKMDVGLISKNLMALNGNKTVDIAKQLVEAGWLKIDAVEFAKDLSAPDIRGMIAKIDSNSKMNEDETRDVKSDVVNIVLGKKRSWLIDFTNSGPEFGMVRSVDKQTFEEFLKNLFYNPK